MKKTLSIVLAVLCLLSVMQGVDLVQALELDELKELNIADGNILIEPDGYIVGAGGKVPYEGDYLIQGSTSTNAITVADGTIATIVIENLSIDLSTISEYRSPLALQGDAEVTLVLSGENMLRSKVRNGSFAAVNPAIWVEREDGKTPKLTIQSVDENDGSREGEAGPNSLLATTVPASGEGGYSSAAAIGSAGGDGADGYNHPLNPCGDIIIESGTVVALANSAAAIGNGSTSNMMLAGQGGGNITIHGGHITARGSNGIGGSLINENIGSFTMTGGQVNAVGRTGSGIGVGSSLSPATGGSILISGGTVNAESEGSGIAVGNGGSITIEGDAQVTAKGVFGAAIGGCKGASPDIIISRGIVKAIVEAYVMEGQPLYGNQSTAIGAGDGGVGGSVNISGGQITAETRFATFNYMGIVQTGGDGPAIGGAATLVEISGGNIVAKSGGAVDIAGSEVAWLGGGIAARTISPAPVGGINRVVVELPLTEAEQMVKGITITRNEASQAYAGEGVQVDEAGKVYLWLTADAPNGVTTIQIIVGNTKYTTSLTVMAGDNTAPAPVAEIIEGPEEPEGPDKPGSSEESTGGNPNQTISEDQVVVSGGSATITLDEGTTRIGAWVYAQLLEQNRLMDVVIRRGNVTITFAKGSMRPMPGLVWIDFDVSLTQRSDDQQLQALLPQGENQIVSFKHSGALPGRAKIEYRLDAAYAGKTLYYSYYNPETNRLEPMQRDTVSSDGVFTVYQDRCSTYVITQSPTGDAKANPSTGANHSTMLFAVGGLLVAILLRAATKKRAAA